MVHHDIGVAEHGAKANVTYARCSCGWSGKPRRHMGVNDFVNCPGEAYCETWPVDDDLRAALGEGA